MKTISVGLCLFLTLALAGCVAQAVPTPTHPASTTPAPTESPASKTAREVAATCSIMSVIDTNLYNAASLRQDGSIDVSDSNAILNTVATDLRLIAGAPGYGLQTELSEIVTATTSVSGTLAGNAFDPLGSGFADPHARVLAACQANDSPVNIVDATNPRADKP